MHREGIHALTEPLIQIVKLASPHLVHPIWISQPRIDTAATAGVLKKRMVVQMPGKR